MKSSNARLASAERRRSQRVLLTVPLLVSGKRLNGSPFEERTSTSLVNAHGALVLLREPVAVEQLVRIQNIKTGEKSDCTVSDVSPSSEGVQEVGLRFAKPSPEFWHVIFPPPDWNSHSPEAKRFSEVAEPRTLALDHPTTYSKS